MSKEKEFLSAEEEQEIVLLAIIDGRKKYLQGVDNKSFIIGTIVTSLHFDGHKKLFQSLRWTTQRRKWRLLTVAVRIKKFVHLRR